MLVQARVLATTLFHFPGGRWGAGIETNAQIKNGKRKTRTTAFCLWDCHGLKEMQSALQAGFSAQP